MHQFVVEARIAAQIENVFERLADFASYGRWLKRSFSFGATTDIEPVPLGAGTRYIDSGPLGRRYGIVTAYEPPVRLGVHQPMRGPGGGTIDIVVITALERDGEATSIAREVRLVFPARLRAFGPALVPLFAYENRRVLRALGRSFEH